MRIPRPIVSVLVAVCLLLGQQGALAHAITHLGDISQERVHATVAEASAPTTDAHSEFCPECVAFAQIGAAAASTSGSDFAAPCALRNVAIHAIVQRTSRLFCFRARAPPAAL